VRKVKDFASGGVVDMSVLTSEAREVGPRVFTE